MKLIWIFFFIQIAFSTQKLAEVHNDQVLSTAIADVIQELFTRHQIQFGTLIYDKVSPHIFDVINGLGRSELFTNLSTSDNSLNNDKAFYESTLIFCESLEEIKKFFNACLPNLSTLYFFAEPWFI